MERNRGSRFRWTRRYGIPLALTVVIVANLLTNREPHRIVIGYGRFKELLVAPEARFQNLRIGRTEITGEVTFPDRLIGGSNNSTPGTDADPANTANTANSANQASPANAADGTDTAGKSAEPMAFRAYRIGAENDPQLFALLAEHAPGFDAEADRGVWGAMVANLTASLIFLLVVLVGILAYRRAMGYGNGPMSFGRGRQRLYAAQGAGITFADVAGIDEAKTELREVVDFLKDSKKYTDLGGRIPKGVLLVGPPGTGKTLLAKSVAGEAAVPFFSISGSDFVEMFVGVGASRVRDLFRDAAQRAPCIVFIDELDALGRSRAGSSVAGHEEREQTLNQLLVEMDGFDSNTGVILMAATNRPEVLDVALLRPGRFDRTVVVDRPDIEGREAILAVHAAKVKKLSPEVNLRRIAALTPGTVGADLSNIVNEAVLLAARRGADQVGMQDFDEAIERGAMGLERKNRIIRPEEKKRVAVHEAGHALVACAVPDSDPVHKVSIIPRGFAGGYVVQRPEMDRMTMTRGELIARIKVALGGTVAEECALSEISTGATSDLNVANRLAAQMVREYGMSRLGRVYLAGTEASFLPGAPLADSLRSHSEETAREVDLAVREIIEAAVVEVRGILEGGRGALSAVSEALMAKEVLEDQELLELLRANGFRMSPQAERSLSESPVHRRRPEPAQPAESAHA